MIKSILRRWRAPLAVAAVFTTIGLATTFVAFRAAELDVRQHRQTELDTSTEQSVKALDERLTASADAIRGLQGLFAVTDPTRADFQEYVFFVLDAEGLQALEFVRLVPTSERVSFVENTRLDRSLLEDGYPGFEIKPATTHDDMFIVDYVEPMAGNEDAFGFDLGTNPSRRSSVEQARDTGDIVASSGIQLVQDTESRYGILLMLPVYEGGRTPQTIDGRREKFIGVVNGVFIVENLVSGIAGIGSTIDVSIYDSGFGEEPFDSWPLLFTSAGTRASAAPEVANETALVAEFEVSVGDRMWTIVAIEGPDYSKIGAINSLPNVVAAVGILLTLAVAITSFTIMDGRARATLAARRATTDLRDQAVRLRVARDHALESDRLKTAFLANMSHELRTPLNAVIGLSSILKNKTFGPLNTKQLDYMNRISVSGDHLLQLIDDLLDLARIEAGNEELDINDVDLSAVVSEMVEMVGPQAEEWGLELSTSDLDTPVMVAADSRRLKQVVLNVICNAAKFTESGGRVRVEMRGQGSDVAVVVTDTGIGIPSNQLGKIFEPFHQVDSTFSKSRPGSGLGLALSKRLAEMHGGDITVESQEGEGSTFTVTLPLVQTMTLLPELVDDAPDAPVTSLPGLRVLVAEDNQFNLDLITDLLDVLGCAVTPVNDGLQALSVAKTEKPDLILLDIQLPSMDGITIAKRLKSHSATQDIRILAVTALAMPDEVQRILEAGCDSYLAKPFTQDQFITAVTNLAAQPVPV